MANPPLGEQDLAAAAASNSTLDSKSELESASSNSAAGSQIAPCEDMDASLGQSMLVGLMSTLVASNWLPVSGAGFFRLCH